MPFTINFSDSSKQPFVLGAGAADGPFQFTQYTSLVLSGPQRSNFGQDLMQSLVYLLEGFAHSGVSEKQPDPLALSSPIQGQLWYNSSTGVSLVFDGMAWNPIRGIPVKDQAPQNSRYGELWVDSATGTLKLFNGNTYQPVAAGYLKQNGTEPLTDDLNCGAFKLLNVAEPTLPSDAATKGYVDASGSILSSDAFVTAPTFSGSVVRQGFGRTVFYYITIQANPGSDIPSGTLLGTIGSVPRLNLDPGFVGSQLVANVTVASPDGCWPVEISVNGEMRTVVTMYRSPTATKILLQGTCTLPGSSV